MQRHAPPVALILTALSGNPGLTLAETACRC